MIKLNFSLVRADEKTTLSLDGLVLTVNGEVTDLATLPDGATANTDQILTCTRTGDDYELTVMLTHGATAPHETRFPESIEIQDGFVLEYDYNAPEVSE